MNVPMMHSRICLAQWPEMGTVDGSWADDYGHGLVSCCSLDGGLLLILLLYFWLECLDRVLGLNYGGTMSCGSYC
jgi:hypothetical protein